MFRILVVAAVLGFAPQALACGMYVPKDPKVNLADVFEQIDEADKPAEEAAAEVAPARDGTEKQLPQEENRAADSAETQA